jgi:hypothetical protein
MAYDFRDSAFLTAREKQLVLRAWLRFLKNGLRFDDFTTRLYEHLHLHCGFIAHTNRLGFYEEYFERGEDTVRFLSQFDGRGNCQSIESGGAYWRLGEYADLGTAMIGEGAKYIPALIENALTSQRQADIAEAQKLLAKHGLGER